MINHRQFHHQSTSFFLLILFILLLNIIFTSRFAIAGKIHIPDNLDDVVDNEEDEEWKEWGKKKHTATTSDEDEDENGPPPDFNKLDPDQIKTEMFKRMKGPVIGFVKLRLGEKRTKKSVSEIAWRWSTLLKSGGTDPNFMGIDLNTIMFTLPQANNVEELRDVLLDQPDAYEVKIGDHVFRRPGDPPIEEVIQKDNENKHKHQSKKEEL